MAKKRGQNEGSIFQRVDGRWVAQVTIENKMVSKYFKTQRECRDWIKSILDQVENGLSLAGVHTTLKDYLQEWLKTASMTLRPKTIEQYTQIVHQHIIPVLGQYKLKDIRPDIIQAFYNSKLASGTSERTVIVIHSTLHRALNLALKLGLIGRNPSDAVNHPKLRRKEMKVLTDTQVRNLLLTAQNSRYATLFQIAVTTGLREGEIIGLRWSDLDWTTRKLTIQRQVQRIKSRGLVYSEPKTRAGRRVIMLGRATLAKLHDHYQHQQLEREFAGSKWKENDLIFCTPIGSLQEPSNLLKAFKLTLLKANLPDMRFHDLRHTAATLMLLENINPKIVQERLGHSDISMTLNTYSHVLPEMQEGAAEKIDDLITMVDVTQEVSHDSR